MKEAEQIEHVDLLTWLNCVSEIPDMMVLP